ADLTEQRLRQAIAVGVRRARELRAKRVVTALPEEARRILSPARAAQAVAEGAVLGHYRFTAYRTDPGAPPLERFTLHARDAAEARDLAAATARGARWGEAACLARDLAATPG